MHQEKYSLSWHSYSDHLKSMMRELMMNEDFTDVTLVTEDKKHVKANIGILSACSPVFKDILKYLKKEKNSSPLMYLRGMQFSEIEAILQFIYLGEVTFYKERMDKFMEVAKSLEIKELCNTDTVSNNEPDVKLSLCNPKSTTKEVEEQIVKSEHLPKQTPQVRRREVVSANDKYECEPCQKKFTSSYGLYYHKQSVHQGVKIFCNQCDYHATIQSQLTQHIQSKHEGVRYPCDQCGYQATSQGHLTTHIQSKHEGVKYACDQCDYQATRQCSLKRHIREKHEDVKIFCDQCDYQAKRQDTIIKHIRSMH